MVRSFILPRERPVRVEMAMRVSQGFVAGKVNNADERLVKIVLQLIAFGFQVMRPRCLTH